MKHMQTQYVQSWHCMADANPVNILQDWINTETVQVEWGLLGENDVSHWHKHISHRSPQPYFGVKNREQKKSEEFEEVGLFYYYLRLLAVERETIGHAQLLSQRERDLGGTQGDITDRKASKGWRRACKLFLPQSNSCCLVYSCLIRLKTIFLIFTSRP